MWFDHRMTAKLSIPEPLKEEFATVDALLRSSAKTRSVDALVLSWVKHEKQLRRLFCFLVFQHPKISEHTIHKVVTAIAENSQLYRRTFIAGIKKLGVTPVEELLSPRYMDLAREMSRIEKHRNKLIHGQITGQGLTSQQLERDVRWIVEWVGALAVAADDTFGYDGLRRNTYRRAKKVAKIAVANYPFGTPMEFEDWLSKLAKKSRR
jgi:hypothetical protein